MRRTAVLIAMLFAMIWQSVALARVGSSVNALADAVHTALHLHEESHHHNDDGSYQRDDSKESVQHVVGDHVSAITALLFTASNEIPPLGSAAPGGLREARVPSPTLAGLLRPPRARA